MHKLSTLLGMPQHRFASIHVVGTNGKSSVTRMTAALLEAHGLSTGACVSPHSARWSERTLVHGSEIGPAEFAAAVQRAAQAAEVVNRGLAEGEAVTQFEVATAASFVALASARVEAAVIEAGLGGRLDATNTIPSRVTALTSIGLDHTQWLGETEEEIAAEKLAVLNDHSTLVLGAVSPVVASLAERTAGERGARLVVAPEDPGAEIRLLARGRFQRRNFALAFAAAEAFLGELDRGRVAEVAAGLAIPGRLERIADGPPTYVDVAHNPDGAAALAEALPEIAGGHPVVACLAILRDKDPKAMIEALAPVLDRVVCTELSGHPPAREEPEPADGPKNELSVRFSATRPGVGAAELGRACAAVGLEAETEPDFEAAVRRGRQLAMERNGVLLITGSHYVLQPARLALGLCED
jgi:dihydrofolate synthase/folylpolyglutamate synthase